jgi:hypothetical protein
MTRQLVSPLTNHIHHLPFKIVDMTLSLPVSHNWLMCLTPVQAQKKVEEVCCMSGAIMAPEHLQMVPDH